MEIMIMIIIVVVAVVVWLIAAECFHWQLPATLLTSTFQQQPRARRSREQHKYVACFVVCVCEMLQGCESTGAAHVVCDDGGGTVGKCFLSRIEQRRRLVNSELSRVVCGWLEAGACTHARTHTQTNSICSRARLCGGDAEHRGRSKAELSVKERRWGRSWLFSFRDGKRLEADFRTFGDKTCVHQNHKVRQV